MPRTLGLTLAVMSGTTSSRTGSPHLGHGTLLSFWAHPDDETYLAGGLMAATVAAGRRVVCVSATAGERGTANPGKWPPDRLGRLRRCELVAAMAVLGITEYRVLDHPDGGLAEVDHELGVDLAGRFIDVVSPDTIVTFGPDGFTFHPDHIAVSRWVTDAWERRGRAARLLYPVMTTAHLRRVGVLYEAAGFYMTDDRPVAAAYHDVAISLRLDREQRDRKVAALAAMASQTRPAINKLGISRFAAMVGEEAFVDAARVTSVHPGANAA